MTTNPEIINYLCQHDQVAVYSKTVVGWMNKKSIDDTTMLSILKALADNKKKLELEMEVPSSIIITCNSMNGMFRDKKKIIHYLLTEAKCDPNADSLIESPLELTTNLEIAKMLIKHGAKVTPELVLRFESMETQNKHIFIKLMLTTWNPDDRDSDGYTALHLVCKAGSPTMVNLLLSVAHCDPNIKSNND